MKRSFGISLLIATVFAALFAVGVPEVSFAQVDQGLDGAMQVTRGEGQPTELFSGNEGGLVNRIITLLLFIVGVLSVIMLIIGGLRFVLSGGDKSKTDAAKNTILYAIIGLLVAFFAYAIINFVVQAISGGSIGGGSSNPFDGAW